MYEIEIELYGSIRNVIKKRIKRNENMIKDIKEKIKYINEVDE